MSGAFVVSWLHACVAGLNPSTLWLHFLDTAVAGTVASYGLIPGAVGAVACYFLPLRYRWPVSLVMLLATIYAVSHWAHFFGAYLVGCADFVMLCAAALCLRAERKRTPVLKQHPWDLVAFALGTIVASLFYEAPMM